MLTLTAPLMKWLRELTDEDIADQCGSSAVERGGRYARAGKVSKLAFEEGELLKARVQGKAHSPYTTTIHLDLYDDGEVEDWYGWCSCPVRAYCKHCVATLVTLRSMVTSPRPHPSVPSPHAVPAWDQALTKALSAADSNPQLRSAVTEQLALLVTTVTDGYGVNASPRLSARPVRMGSQGRWVKTGASWTDVQNDYYHKFPPAQREALAAVYVTAQAYRHVRDGGSSYGYPYLSPQDLPLADVGPQLGQVLAQVTRSGIPLLSSYDGPGRVVVATEPASVALDLRRVSGTVQLAGQVEWGNHVIDPGKLIWLGKTPFMLACQAGMLGAHEGADAYSPNDLLLIPLDPPVTDTAMGLVKLDGVTLQEDQLGSFYSRHYVQLLRHLPVKSRDASVELPTVEPPRLGINAQHLGDHHTLVSWQLQYQVGDQVSKVGFPLEPDQAREHHDVQEAFTHLAALARDHGVELASLPGVQRNHLGQVSLDAATTQGMDTVRMDELLRVVESLAEVEVRRVGEWPDYRQEDQLPTLDLSLTDADTEEGGSHNDWFNLSIRVLVGDREIPFHVLFAALSRGEPDLLFEDGTWFDLRSSQFDPLREIIAEAYALRDHDTGQLRLSRYHAGFWRELVEQGVVSQQSSRWQQSVGKLLNLHDIPDPALPAGMDVTLRSYQQEGYRWLSLLWDLQLGGVLADDMGLGKTVQALAMIARAHEAGQLERPILIVAPTSVVGTWVSEAAKFCPSLRVVPITQTAKRRPETLTQLCAQADVVVTTYTLLRLEKDDYQQQPWAGVLLDEAQQVKNHQSLTYGAVRRLSTDFVLALTGTPLENSLMDLWSMMSLVAPGLYPDPKDFESRYRRPIEAGVAPQMLARLRTRIRPLMLRRTKDLVAADLPPKQEQVLSVDLAPAHRRIYDRQLARERQRVLGLLDDFNAHRIAILASLMTMRRLSLDPTLVASTVEYSSGKVLSAKLDVLVEKLTELAAEGHRALVFSQFTDYLALAKKRLDAHGITYTYLDGRTRNRAARIAEFTDGDASAFLISLKAGGFGLTLTQADYVFVLDPWWNPAVEAQAVDRAHRIGQTRPVNVYRLVSTDTIEEKVVALQQRKRELFTSVIDDGELLSSALTAEDIRGLLSG